MNRVRNIMGDGTIEGTITSGTTATFASAPTKTISYNYLTNLNETHSMDVTITLGSEEPETVSVDIKTGPTTAKVEQGETTDSLSYTAVGDATISWRLDMAEATAAGITADPTTGTGGTFAFKLTAASTTASADYAIKVIADNGTTSKDVTLTLTVTEPVTPPSPEGPTLDAPTKRITATLGDGEITPVVITATSDSDVKWSTDPALPFSGLTGGTSDDLGLVYVISGEPDEVISRDIRVFAENDDGVTSVDIAVKVTAGSGGSGSSGGCNAGFGLVGLAVLAGLFGLKRK